MTPLDRKPILLCARVDGADRLVHSETKIANPVPPTRDSVRVPCADCGCELWRTPLSGALGATRDLCFPCARAALWALHLGGTT